MKRRPLKYFCTGPPLYGLNVPAGRYLSSGVRFLRTTDIGNDGRLASGIPGVFLDPDEVPHDYVLRHGDLLFSRSGTLGRSLLFEEESTRATHAGYLVRFRPHECNYAPYLAYCAQSNLLQDAVGADAIESTIGNFNAEKYGNVRLPWWPRGTQRAIAGYLDRETARIDALITAKRRMTELLNERLTSLRDHAFASKPGWRLKRLLADPMAYGVLVPEFVEGGTGVPMVRTYNLSTKGRIDHGDIAEIPEALAREYRRTSLHQGDVILSVVGSMGRSAVVGPDEQGFNLNRPLARLRLRPEVPPRLLWHWTQTTHFMDLAKLATGGGTAQPTLNLGDLAGFTIGLPQGAELWPGILSNLEEMYEQINETEQLVSRQIALLLERRQALITAAVTGQLDIPEAA